MPIAGMRKPMIGTPRRGLLKDAAMHLIPGIGKACADDYNN